MSGKLHLPVPMMILAGPIYRGHLSVMSILFVSTVVLSGPASPAPSAGTASLPVLQLPSATISPASPPTGPVCSTCSSPSACMPPPWHWPASEASFCY
jgi:hypothetical protein